MAIQLPELSEHDLRSVIAQMNSQGFSIVENYVAPATLASMRQLVDALMRRSGGEYIVLDKADSFAGTIIEEISGSEIFKSLMQQLCLGATCGKAAPATNFHIVFRCLGGKTAKSHCLNFHYDSYVVTALIPVEIPQEGKTGDLIMLPNTRKIRRTYVANLVDKLLLDNRLTQSILTYLLAKRMMKFTRIRLIPGNLYLFWGYRSIHTNEGCDEDKVRATALFHYANPHVGNKLSRRLKLMGAGSSQPRAA